MEGLTRHTSETHAAARKHQSLQLLREHGTSPDGQRARLTAAGKPGDSTFAVSFAALATQLVAALCLRLFPQLATRLPTTGLVAIVVAVRLRPPWFGMSQSRCPEHESATCEQGRTPLKRPFNP